MNIILNLLKILFVTVLFLLKGSAMMILAILSQKDSNESSTKSIYLLDENGDEFIDDGVTFGFELDDSIRYRNRP